MFEAILVPLATALVLLLLWRFLHRDPDIAVRRTQGYLSPADGLVAAVIPVGGKKVRLPKGRHGITAFVEPWAKTVVVIMMRPEHIHTQRAPVDGRVVSVTHKPGTLRNAVFGDWRAATVENEHVKIRINGKRRCAVYLIAGLLARRIRPVVRKGSVVKQGERIGRIAFGSQVALVLPTDKILVSVGERAHVGVTRVA